MKTDQPPSRHTIEAISDHGFAGVRAVLNIVGAWQLSEQQTLDLLGINRATLRAWRRGEIGSLTGDNLVRLSYVLGIRRALRELLAESADAWVLKANTDPLFNSRPAIELMTKGVDGLRTVRRYLEAQLV